MVCPELFLKIIRIYPKKAMEKLICPILDISALELDHFLSYINNVT